MDDPNEAAGALVDGLFRLARVLSLYGPIHPSGQAALLDVQRKIEHAQPPFALQFVMGGVFREHTLVPMSLERYERVAQVANALRALGVHELSFEQTLDTEALSELSRIVSGSMTTLVGVEVRGVRWRVIVGVEAGGEAQRVDPDVFASAQAALAIGDSFHLTREGPWPWPAGLKVIRRLDRAAEVNLMAALGTIERANAEWNPQRRAVAGALRVLALLRTLGTGVLVQRAATHAVLGLLIQGLEERAGIPLEVAAVQVLERMAASGAVAHGAETHRLRSISLLDHLARRAPYTTSVGESLGRLIRLTYQLEMARCPENLEFDLSIVELLAEAANSTKTDVDFLWLRMLIQLFGVLPPGAEVHLSDGRTGYVLGPGGSRNPMRPDVMVDGRRHTPTADVELMRPSTRRGNGC